LAVLFPAESATGVLEKCSWDVARGVVACRVLPHSQATVHLLDIAREWVFVGKEDSPVILEMGQVVEGLILW
jgi:hypothetical protein